jgi:hypothetical protein
MARRSYRRRRICVVAGGPTERRPVAAVRARNTGSWVDRHGPGDISGVRGRPCRNSGDRARDPPARSSCGPPPGSRCCSCLGPLRGRRRQRWRVTSARRRKLLGDGPHGRREARSTSVGPDRRRRRIRGPKSRPALRGGDPCRFVARHRTPLVTMSPPFVLRLRGAFRQRLCLVQAAVALLVSIPSAAGG